MTGSEQLTQELRSYIVSNYLFSTELKLTDNDSFLENGLIDSTGVLELASYLEEKYGIEVNDEELVPENLDSIAAMSQYVQRKLNRA
jgi:acyl carrier protein